MLVYTNPRTHSVVVRCSTACTLAVDCGVPATAPYNAELMFHADDDDESSTQYNASVTYQRHLTRYSLAAVRAESNGRVSVSQSVRPSVCHSVVIAVAATRAYGRLLSAIAKVHYSQTLTLTLTLTLTPAPTLTLTSAMIDVGWSGLTWRRRSSRTIGRRRGIQRQRHVPVPGRILVLPRPTVGRFNTLSVHRSLSSPVIRRATLPDSLPKYMSTIQRNVSRCMWFYRDVYALSSTCRHDGLWTALSRDECKRQ